nr:protein-disulfide reductase DsbD domain-containing protein [Sphingomonas piscis]
MIQRILVLLAALLLLPTLAQARGIEPEMVAEGPVQPGGEVELALHMRTNPGWHGYWQNPGDAGLPMTVDWTLPDGASVGPLRYPVPTRLLIAGLMNYVFEREYAVLVRLKVPADARGTVPIRAAARWLACTDKVCVPEEGELSTNLVVGTGAPDRRPQFDTWRQALPQPLAAPVQFATAGDKLRLAIPLPASVRADEPYVFLATEKIGDYAGEQKFSRSGDTLVAELPRKGGGANRFEGVVALGDGRGLSFQAVPGAVPDASGTTGGSETTLLWALLGAIAGGILLNLMPCVFPILALKALHLSKAGGDSREARRDALAYAAGAIVGTGALGAAILAIRAGGSAVGWAFQLQDPRTIVLLFLLALAITLNLLRLFELPVLGGSARPAGGFGTGLLAAFVATPCAGPFMGAALGAALLLPPAGSLLVFAALGFGLALPFVLVAFVPALRRRLPKPGAWMARLQRFLAIPMAATAAACLWLLWRQGGMPALQLAAAAGVIVAAMLVSWGWAQRNGERRQGWAIAAVIVLVSLGAMIAVPGPAPRSAAAKSVNAWSEAKVAAQLGQGGPVFVYFTADWCLTCKANEAAAIDRPEVQDAFEKAGVKVLVGDWTNGDPAITRFLESRGRAGVPLYLWYAPGQPAEELPQVLTPGMLISRATAR